MQFIVNDNNTFYKNYIIRSYSHLKEITLVNYKTIADNLNYYIDNSVVSNGSPIFGNWIEGYHMYEGLNGYNFVQNYSRKKEKIQDYIKIIDNISQYEKIQYDNIWFFICLFQVSNMSMNIAEPYPDRRKISIDYLDWNGLSEILSKKVLDPYLKEGQRLGYFGAQDDEGYLRVNKESLYRPFLEKITDIIQAVKIYDETLFNNQNKELHNFKVENIEFFAYKGKIIYKDGNTFYMTKFDDFGSVKELNTQVRKNLLQELLGNKVAINSLDDIISGHISGQVLAFYLDCLFNDSSKNTKIIMKEIPPQLSREMQSKDQKEKYVSFEEGVRCDYVSDKFLEQVSGISTYTENIKEYKKQHTAISYIKNAAKQLKKSNKDLSLMQIQDFLSQEIFSLNVTQLYEKIETDLIDTYEANSQYEYATQKDTSKISLGKNHIGFYALQEINSFKHHMAYIDNASLIEDIKRTHKVINFEDYKGLDSQDREVAYIYLERLEINTKNLQILEGIICQGRSFNKFLMFNFQSLETARFFLSQPLFVANTSQFSYSREIYESLFSTLEPLKIAVKKVIKTQTQTEYLV